MKIEFETTDDGSHTLFIPELNEHYHSTNGAIQEANHVFIDTALGHCTKREINVLEIGFGTGLNAFMTMLKADNSNIKIHYTTLELYPITISDSEELNYADIIDKSKKDLFNKLHTVDWEKTNVITPNFSIHKKQSDFSQPAALMFQNNKFDVVYFDAFGPDKQPEMWQGKLFEKIYLSMAPGGILTTYSAKGAIRRLLQSIGFKMERLPGPPGKREMLRGVK